MIREGLQRRRAEEEQHALAWRPYTTANAAGLNLLQIDFEARLRHLLGSSVEIAREIERDCNGKDVLWLIVQPQGLQIAIYDSLIQVAGRHFFEEWDGTPAEVIGLASKAVLSELRSGT